MIYNRNRLLLEADNRPARLTTEPDGLVFHIEGHACHSVSDECAATLESSALRWVGLRECHPLLPAEEYRTACKGAELIWWDTQSQFCSVCGAPMERASEISKRCTGCNREIWPQLSPAIVVLVKRGEEALLVHAANFRAGIHALVAGFVETGETLEECVAREVREETSLEIDDIRYYGSQSWPFPAQMMMAFTARYRSGEIRFADHELTSGGFFSRECPPPLPTPPSLSRRLIDAWLNGEV